VLDLLSLEIKGTFGPFLALTCFNRALLDTFFGAPIIQWQH